MKVVFETNEVLQKLSQVSSVINSKNALPILSNLCITVKNEHMIATASDSDMWVTERVNVASSEGDCTFCVNAQDVTQILGSLKGETVKMCLDEDKRLVVFDYGNGKVNLPYESAEEYPHPLVDLEEAKEWIISGEQLRYCIEITQNSIANDELRPIMNGIHFDFSDGKITATSCSMQRMTRYSSVDDRIKSEGSFTVPKKAAMILQTILQDVDDDVKIRFTDSAASISNRNIKITSKLLEGNYPNCDVIIPKETPFVVEVEKNVVQQALRHVMSVNDSGSLISCEFGKDSLTVSAENIAMNKSATETIRCNNSSEEPMTICFNGNVLSDMLKNVRDDNVVFGMVAEKAAAVIFAKDAMPREQFLSLIMPMVKKPNIQEEKQQ